VLQAFVAGLPVRALRGVGFKSESVLRGWGVVTAGDAAALSKQMLVQGLGEKQGKWHSCYFCAAGRSCEESALVDVECRMLGRCRWWGH
jgi:nucleotidyltransferase/DNA polymerase involved in DNA repair